MIEQVKVFPSSEGNVWKYVFTGKDVVAEAVLYRYMDFYQRTVICCSTMSGCPVGCTFCGTGKKFVRNLTADEIVYQILQVLKGHKIEDVDLTGRRFQIMFMSMGEPMLNWVEVEKAIRRLHIMYPNAELLLSTVGIMNDDAILGIYNLGKEVSKFGLQFSIHKSNNEDRNILIPFKNKMLLQTISYYGSLWSGMTGRPVFLNYCIDGTNNTSQDFQNLVELFDNPRAFRFTFSVVCSADESMKDAGYKNLDAIQEFQQKFMEAGYDCRTFDPAGQDDIGGGCGQLWYVQKWMKENGRMTKEETK